MNLFSWLYTISWIGIFLFMQSLLKTAHATPPSPDSSILRDNHFSIKNSLPSAVSRTLQLRSAGSVTLKEPLAQPVSPLSSRLRTALVAEAAPAPSSPLAVPIAKLVSPATPAEGLNPVPQPSFTLLQARDLLQTRDSASGFAAGATPSYPLLQLVTNLSRWTKGISEALQLTAPLVTVVPIAPSPLDTDRWNVLPLNSPTSLPAEAESPQPSCMGEAARFPATLSSLFQVQVRGHAVAEFPLQEQADRFADRLRQVLQMDNFDPQTLRPVLLDNTPGGKAGEVPLFWVEPELSLQLDRSAELLAITWINSLRTALNVPALSLVESQKQMHDLVATDDRLDGTASWYGPYFHGRITATGETFDQTELTAAHPSLPFDTYLKVTNLKTGNSVIVRINDRGPYFEDRSLDLSREAARCLNSEISGVVPYEAVIMKRSSGVFDSAPADPTSAKASGIESSKKLFQNTPAVGGSPAIDPSDPEEPPQPESVNP